MSGRLHAIYIGTVRGQPLVARGEILAVADRGLEGDRYFTGEGTFSKAPDPGAQVTLIESEAFEALQRDYGIALEPQEARRNLVTRDVALNHLVGREFAVGEVRLEGVELCDPCGHLQRLAGKPIKKPLAHRGGLRARILTGGVLRVGDPITV
jgi:MOSC domain-containing protein YiiM